MISKPISLSLMLPGVCDLPLSSLVQPQAFSVSSHLNNGEISSWEQSLDPPQGYVINESFLTNGHHLANPLGLFLLTLLKSPRQPPHTPLIGPYCALALCLLTAFLLFPVGQIRGNSKFQSPIQFFHVWTVACGYRIPLRWELETLWRFCPVSVLRVVLTPYVCPSMSLPPQRLFS